MPSLPQDWIDLITSTATRLGQGVEYLLPQIIAVYWLGGVYWLLALPIYVLLPVLLVKNWTGPRLITAFQSNHTSTLGLVEIWWGGISLVLLLVAIVASLNIIFLYPYYLQVAFFPEGRLVLDVIEAATKTKTK